MTKNVCLIIIDGWGISPKKGEVEEIVYNNDSIRNAKTPFMDNFMTNKKIAFREIIAHGIDVGLPEGEMGNSEVGHINIGGGRIIYQDVIRIRNSIKDRSIEKIKGFEEFIKKSKKAGKAHIFGIISDGGVHGNIEHIIEIMKIIKDSGVKNCILHAILDGRDTSPRSSPKYIKQIYEFIQKENYGKIGSISGRYYSMDRGGYYERTKLAFDAIVYGKSKKIIPNYELDQLLKYIDDEYLNNGTTDEFFYPTVIGDEFINDGEPIIFTNYRKDRMLQMIEAFLGEKKDYGIIPRENGILPLTMTCYDARFKLNIIFPPIKYDNFLAEWLSKKRIPHMHIAEKEKIAHVTYFFNGGIKERFELEDRIELPSPNVETYDLDPKMNSRGVAEAVIESIKGGKHPFILCNFAPPDMVGHTGNYEAAIKACEATDQAIGMIYQACKDYKYTLFVTSDHGNAEMMKDSNGDPFTAHTCSPVPFIIVDKSIKLSSEKAALCDVAPTILDYMKIEKPNEMTGKSLIIH